jgi:hypothetical protein
MEVREVFLNVLITRGNRLLEVSDPDPPEGYGSEPYTVLEKHFSFVS